MKEAIVICAIEKFIRTTISCEIQIKDHMHHPRTLVKAATFSAYMASTRKHANMTLDWGKGTTGQFSHHISAVLACRMPLMWSVA